MKKNDITTCSPPVLYHINNPSNPGALGRQQPFSSWCRATGASFSRPHSFILPLDLSAFFRASRRWAGCVWNPAMFYLWDVCGRWATKPPPLRHARPPYSARSHWRPLQTVCSITSSPAGGFILQWQVSSSLPGYYSGSPSVQRLLYDFAFSIRLKWCHLIDTVYASRFFSHSPSFYLPPSWRLHSVHKRSHPSTSSANLLPPVPAVIWFAHCSFSCHRFILFSFPFSRPFICDPSLPRGSGSFEKLITWQETRPGFALQTGGDSNIKTAHGLVISVLILEQNNTFSLFLHFSLSPSLVFLSPSLLILMWQLSFLPQLKGS